MWEQTLRRWIDLVFWWLPRPESERAAPDSAKQAADPAPRQATPEPAAAPRQTAAFEGGAPRQAPASDAAADDLTVIKGIGPAVQKKLHALGIRTFGDLAAADPETLTEQLKGRQPISQALVRGWTEAAERAGQRH